jgi:hypothetical protein
MTGDADMTRSAASVGGLQAARGLVRAVALLLVVGCSAGASADQPGGFTIAQLKYRGGGDWYANPTALPNLLAGIASRTDLDVAERPASVAPDDEELFLYPMIHMTGHGRVAFTDEEAGALREYFERGGFLWADDNYGMDRHLRAQLDRVLPGSRLVELPFDHEIFHSFYEFPEGLPKIHEHDGGPPHGYGVYLNGRMVVFYSFNTDIGDGLEDGEVHNDPPEKREAALRMGINIAVYALSH